MAEWSNAAVLKTVDCNRSGGSNPSFSARVGKILKRPTRTDCKSVGKPSQVRILLFPQNLKKLQSIKVVAFFVKLICNYYLCLFFLNNFIFSNDNPFSFLKILCLGELMICEAYIPVCPENK